MQHGYPLELPWRPAYKSNANPPSTRCSLSPATRASIRREYEMSTRSSAITCRACGAESVFGAKFCRSCGASIRTETRTATIVCDQCRYENAPKAKFCRQCGNSLASVPSVASDLSVPPGIHQPEAMRAPTEQVGLVLRDEPEDAKLPAPTDDPPNPGTQLRENAPIVDIQPGQCGARRQQTEGDHRHRRVLKWEKTMKWGESGFRGVFDPSAELGSSACA